MVYFSYKLMHTQNFNINLEIVKATTKNLQIDVKMNMINATSST